MDPSPNSSSTAADDTITRFSHGKYLLRRKVFKIFGGAFHIYDPEGNVALYSKMKAFKLREDIRMYTSEAMDQEVIRISTGSVFDFSGAYDVVDSITEARVGTLKRAGLKSLFRDEWQVLDEGGNQIGTIQEDSTLKALVRRGLDDWAFVFPQKFHIDLAGQTVAVFSQNFNPLVQKIALDFSMDTQGLLDPRLGLAAGVLMCAIEGRQD